MPDKLIIAFDRLKDSDVLAKADLIITSVYGHPELSARWTDQLPSQAVARAALELARTTYQSSLTRDTLKIAARQEARGQLTAVLKLIANGVELIAQGDTKLLAASGFDLRRDSARTGAARALPGTPEGLRVLPTLDAGTLNLSMQKTPGAAACEIQLTQGDPGDDAGWQHAQTVVQQLRIRLGGLPPGRTWARVRGVSRSGPGPWASPVSVVVI